MCTFDLVIANSWFVQFHLLFLLFCLTASFRCMPIHCILVCSQSSTAKSKFNWSYYLTWYCFIATPLCRFSIRGVTYLSFRRSPSHPIMNPVVVVVDQFRFIHYRWIITANTHILAPLHLWALYLLTHSMVTSCGSILTLCTRRTWLNI